MLESLLLKSIDDYSITFDSIKTALKKGIDINEDNKINQNNKKVDFIQFGYDLAEEKKKLRTAKGIVKEGNAKVYDNVLNQFTKYKSSINVLDIDYNTLVEFKDSQLRIGNKKNTINSYLRTLRAIYNEALRRYKFKVDHKPFEGIFKDVTVKLNRTKKRHISKQTLKILEYFEGNLARGQQEAIDLFLLQFYFGGQDLTDIFYLEKKQVSKNQRIYFTRGKLEDGGYEFDLKIFLKASVILQKYKYGTDGFVFNWRKDFKGYNNFRNRLNKNLRKIQDNYNDHVRRIEYFTGVNYHKIDVLPLEGYITTKVARHTFATIGSRLYIEPDLLRSLMGHERDHVDTIYKDVYPEEERDKYHKQIIDTSGIEVEQMYVYQLEYFNSDRIRKWKYRYFKELPSETELIEEVTLKKYSQPRYFKQIYLIRIEKR